MRLSIIAAALMLVVGLPAGVSQAASCTTAADAHNELLSIEASEAGRSFFDELEQYEDTPTDDVTAHRYRLVEEGTVAMGEGDYKTACARFGELKKDLGISKADETLLSKETCTEESIVHRLARVMSTSTDLAHINNDPTDPVTQKRIEVLNSFHAAQMQNNLPAACAELRKMELEVGIE